LVLECKSASVTIMQAILQTIIGSGLLLFEAIAFAPMKFLLSCM